MEERHGIVQADDSHTNNGFQVWCVVAQERFLLP
jgi:hypothetical protein